MFIFDTDQAQINSAKKLQIRTDRYTAIVIIRNLYICWISCIRSGDWKDKNRKGQTMQWFTV